MENQLNFYELRFQENLDSGLTVEDSVLDVIQAYLDNKPANRKLKAVDRNRLFWSSRFLEQLPVDVFETESFVLALARYMGQEEITNTAVVNYFATEAPASMYRAIRYSGLILRQNTSKWKEVEQLAATHTSEFSELVEICHIFKRAHNECVDVIDMYKGILAELSPLELLSYISVYAFQNLLLNESDDDNTSELWSALNDILLWKLQASSDDDFIITEASLGASLREHLSPFIFPSPSTAPVREDLYLALHHLVEEQVELNSFLSQSVDAFCYDDSIRFEMSGPDMQLVEVDPDARKVWERNGVKLTRLHQYWFYRALDEFVESGMAETLIGTVENHEDNQIAYIKALRAYLRLSEVYGVADKVAADTGLQVDLFQAVLSLELMSAFYRNDFVFPYQECFASTGSWQVALSQLAMDGLLHGSQNRFPITWSDRDSKVRNIRPWTVTKEFPKGHVKAAEAILDFWTNDLKDLSRQLRSAERGIVPNLYERPILKMGRYLFQLPWMVAYQNNSSAAVNNLRRIGSKRKETGEETRRIEKRLAHSFEARGFRVVLNYQPPRVPRDDPGEIDLVCLLDGQLLVIEVKSTFIRRTAKDAWLYKTVTLRKAGLQIRRKLEAVKVAIESKSELFDALGLEAANELPVMRGWIVDTSIEHDHERFSGFLKVSLEEVMIALRDDAHLLSDPVDDFATKNVGELSQSEIQQLATLYPDGFSADDFIEVIEQERVWANLA